jgi:hypothetical protein
MFPPFVHHSKASARTQECWRKLNIPHDGGQIGSHAQPTPFSLPHRLPGAQVLSELQLGGLEQAGSGTESG